MPEKIQLRRSSVAGRVPTTAQLDLGEIGINTHDGKVFIKKDDGAAAIVEVGGGIADIEQEIDELPNSSSAPFVFDDLTSGAALALGEIRCNNTNWNSTTVIYVSTQSSTGKNIKNQAETYLERGTVVFMQNMSSTEGSSYLKASVASRFIGTNEITIYLISGSLETNGDTPSEGDKIAFGVVPTGNSYSLEEALGFDVTDNTGVGAFTTTELTDNATLKSTLETLGDKAQKLRDGLGVAVGDSDLGTFAGSTIQDNQSVKGALRDLEIAAETGAISVNASRYKFSTSVGAGPGTGKLRYDSTSTSSVDRIYLHDTDRDGRDLKSFFDFMLKKGVYVYVTSPTTDDTLFAQLSTDAVHTTDYYTIDLANIQIAGNVPSADEALTFGLAIGPAVSGTGQLNVANNTVPEYSDNTAAKAGGLVDGDVYRTSGGNLKIVYT